jgi:molecular chaperone GrpE
LEVSESIPGEDVGGDAGTEPTGSSAKALEEERARSQELLTRLKYAQADLENLRKRTDRELKEAGEAAVRGLVLRLLVVLDELELAVRHSTEGETRGELREGIAMVQRNLESALESVGVKRIESVGKPFDPALHEAVDKVQGRSRGEDYVIEELRPGFVFRGQLLRPSMVKVELASKRREEEASASE